MHPTSAHRSILHLAVATPLLFAVPGLADTQPAPAPVDAEERAGIVERIVELLDERYVFPEVGTRCGDHLKSLEASDQLDEFSDPKRFAEEVTAALQSISKDKHLRVRFEPPRDGSKKREDPLRARARGRQERREVNFGFERVERLDGNIGYVDLRFFAGSSVARDTATAAMSFLAHTDAIIFDLRKNGGGSPDMVRYLSSYFFAEPTHLNSLYWRQGDVTQEFWTLAEVPGRQKVDKPIFVLTSSRTFSGAEEFSYNMQTQKRGTLIGATTGGGANPGGVTAVNARFSIFIPTGTAINPITGKNWEGVGVQPDLEVPAEEALEVALEKAREAAEGYRAAAAAEAQGTWDAFADHQERAEALIQDGKEGQAAEVLTGAVELGRQADLLGEAEINLLGYHYLGQGQTELAIAVFQHNVEAYPESGNVYDSLGEAYMEDGQKKLAVQHYEKSLEIDPDNTNAVAMLEKLRAGS